jgi:hypothetical protein
MHKAILGTADDVNRANAQTAQELFEAFLVTDRLDRWRDTLNCYYLPLFGSTGDGVEFDHDDAVTSNREADAVELKSKAASALDLVTAGYDPHGVLETVGLPDMAVVEKATQEPALPPGWIATPPTAPGTPAAPATPDQGSEADTETPDGDGGYTANRRTRSIRAAAADDGTGDADDSDDGEGEGGGGKTAPQQNLDDVDRHWKEAVALLVAVYLVQIIPGQIKQLSDQVRRLIADGDTAGLAQLTVDSADGAQLLTTSMTGMANTAAKQAVAEAAKAGVTIDPKAADAAMLATIATTIAALQAAGLALSAGSLAARLAAAGDADPEDVAAQVETGLGALSDASLTSKLAGGLSAAQNESRIATFLAGPSVDLFASEVNDRNTCKACQDIDGQYIGNSRDENINDEIDALYPNGGFIGCAGGDRCRGTVIADYVSDSGGTGTGDLPAGVDAQLPFFLVDLNPKPAATNGHNLHEKTVGV